MAKEKKPKDWIFECQKCSHQLYVDQTYKQVKSLLKLDCPECGEEPCWMLIGEGVFKG